MDGPREALGRVLEEHVRVRHRGAELAHQPGTTHGDVDDARAVLPDHHPPLDQPAIATGTVIVVVWTTWSPRGGDIVQRLNRIDSDWRGRARVLSVVFQESGEAVDRFLAGKRLVVPVFLDTGNAEFSKRHNVTQVPRLLVFKDGVTAVNVNLTDDPNPLISGALE